MHQVADGLYVGGIAAVNEGATLRDAAIEVVVGLTHDPPAGGYPDAVRVVREPMMDGPRNESPAFERAVEATLDAVRSDERTLVHCSAGASRSVAVAAAALTETTDRDLEAAFRQVVDRRPPADPHPALVRRAADYLGYES